jgi:hypothetical protein
MDSNGIRRRIHAGKECAARGDERLVGLEDDGKLDQIVAPDPHQRSRTGFGCDSAAVRERVAVFTERDKRITRGQVEWLLCVCSTRIHHPRIFP